jgi:O-acetylhomoserine/O-acetylserine sulfhydrylase-like pyridoxal-dependent enzyme
MPRISRSYLETGDELITDLYLYGCTFSLFSHGFSRFVDDVDAVLVPEKEHMALIPPLSSLPNNLAR